MIYTMKSDCKFIEGRILYECYHFHYAITTTGNTIKMCQIAHLKVLGANSEGTIDPRNFNEENEIVFN